ncbi:MAG TPA: tRNA (adenosine(37)-N6)-dimethylallyltransferase MiaA [Chitinophagaceae bacterium]|nr:tRNA (adenosine(37)-N6)-dimethylallyltransferase MiaA [Chitinophagaceae bacterium]
MKDKTCLVIVGPTAVGKTSVAIALAQHFNTQIISADSRQCYKELNIGVAKPSPEQLQQVNHWFINSHSIQEEVNAGVFEEYALQKAYQIFGNNKVAVMVGGTGLYVKAFCEGMDELPVIDASVRNNIVSNFKNSGLSWLQNEVEKNDPVYFSKGEIKNPQRMMRALEVKLSTGRSIIEFQSHEKKERDFNIIKIGLELPKEQLHQNINKRVDDMMHKGLLDEVKSLSSYKHLNALQTVGYKELFDHPEGKISLKNAIEQIKINTRHYAKRQMTWFKKDNKIQWIAASNILQVIEVVQNSLSPRGEGKGEGLII